MLKYSTKVLLFLGLQYRILWNSFQGSRLLMVVLGGLFLGGQAIFGLFLAAGVGSVAFSEAANGYYGETVPLYICALGALWLGFSVLEGGQDAFLRFGRYLAFPLKFSQIYALRLGIHLVKPRLVMFLPALVLGVMAGYEESLLDGALTGMALGLGLLWAMLAGLGLRNVMEQLLRRLIGGRTIFAALRTVGLLAALVGFLYFQRLDSFTLQEMELDYEPLLAAARQALPLVYALFPVAYPSLAIEALEQSRWLLAAGFAASYLGTAWIATLLGQWGMFEAYYQRFPESRPAHATRLQAGLLAQMLSLLPGPGGLHGLLQRELLALGRNWRIILSMFTPLIPLAIYLPLATGNRGPEGSGMAMLASHGPAMLGVFLPFMASSLQANLFGFEGRSIEHYALLPLRPRWIFIAKNCVYGGILAVAYGLLVGAIFGLVPETRLDAVLQGVAMFAAVFLLSAAVENIMSLTFPYATEKPQGFGTAMKATLFGNLPLAGISMLSLGGYTSAGMLGGRSEFLATLLVLAVMSYGLGLWICENLWPERWEPMLEALSSN